MKKLVLFFIVFISISVYAQQAKVNFGLRAAINSSKSEDLIALFVHGDVLEIKREVNKLGGRVKLSTGNIVQVDVPAGKIVDFSKNDFVDFIEYSLSKGTVLNDTMIIHNNVVPIHNGVEPLDQPYTGKGVVLGFIDTGIDIYHPDFKDTLGNTRILAIWDQYNSDDGSSSYGYGQVWDSSAINNNNCTHVDHNGVNHGTHVAGIAAGNGLGVNNYRGVAPESNLVVVASNQGVGNWLSTVVDAVNFIYDVADSYNMPCVINVSMGDYFGSHDGEDAASLLIDSIVNYKEGRAFVAAAGNAGDFNTYKFHLEHQITNDTTFTWFKYNGSSALGYGSVFYELWADTADFNNVEFSVGANLPSGTYEERGTTPFYNIKNILGLQTDTIKNDSSQVLGIVDFYTELQGNKYLMQVHMQEPDSNQLLFSLKTTGNGRMDVWTMSALGTSNYVYSPLPLETILPEIVNYVLPDSLKSMVSSFQNVESLLTVANFVNRATYIDVDTILRFTGKTPGFRAASSSRGPTRRGTLKPDIAATGDYVIGPVSAGVIAANMVAPTNRMRIALGGMHRYNGGTSMASPVIAGVAALYFEKCNTSTMAEVKNAITSTAKSDGNTGSVPNIAFGYGKVDAFAALNTSNFTFSLGTDIDICDGDSAQINAGVYSSYLWSTGDTTSSIYLDSTNSIYTEVINESGCRSWSDTINVTWHPLPIKPFINVVGNDTLIYATNLDLQWYYNTDSLVGENDTILVAQSNGDYFLQVSDSFGCKSNSDTINVIILTVQQQNSASGVKLYPNPTQGIFKAEIKDLTIKSLILIDIQGRELYTEQVSNQSVINLDLSHLPNGIYYLKILKEVGFDLEKVIIAR
ncbi:S8 family serine peptidase [Vicingus serpentipes]|uniref:S8 family serine peptidase n=1 Tax=Vicingus serpentipes TaxID=1926625 RepID=A0A5C6RWS5_9FLAO|nr:S8 family serine peptidase [Vicingus serpentipes]TXB66808.1 S8 family serine peptidase [Vicingus serpentipes]